MIIDGKKLSQEVIENLREERKKLSGKIRLAAVLIGDDPASLSFIKQKKKVGEKIGIELRLYRYPTTIKTKELRHQVGKLCRLPANKGLIVQLPLPSSINTQSVLNAILPLKDVDVLCEKNLGAFYTGRLPILPPVVAAIRFILEKYKISLEGKNVLIIGRGRLVGKPAMIWCVNQRATVIEANQKTKNLPELMKEADVIITSAGKPDLVKGDLVKPGVIIFDAAVMTEKGKLRGDCDLDSLREKARLITPVPGGLGPLTVAFLYANLLELIKRQR